MIMDNKSEQLAEALSDKRIKRIERNASSQVVVYLEGQSEPIVDVKIARCFPWSNPDGYISIIDSSGKEIALYETLDAIEASARAIVAQELDDKIFNPQITRVLELKHEFGVTSVRVDTDRGEVSFEVRSRDDVRILSATRALFRDADGNTYELADLNTLDAGSRKYLAPFF